MKIKELEKLVETATSPEDIFGWDVERADASKLFKQYRSLVHADKFPDDDMKDYVHEISVALNIQWKLALSRFKAGTYGDKTVITSTTKDEYVIKSKKTSYAIESTFTDANLCDVFKTTCNHVLKLGRGHNDNDLLEAEAKILKALQDDLKTSEYGHNMLPEFVESFKIKNDKHEKVVVNVLKFIEGSITIKELRSAFSGRRLNPRHVIWIWKRILSVLGVVHNAGYVHGAMVPSNVMISPANHGASLIDFCYAVPLTKELKVIDSQYKAFYPPETFEDGSKRVLADFDIYMVGKLMIYLVGGDVETNSIPDYIPKRMQNLIKSSVIKSRGSRYTNAWELYDIVSTLGKELYGKPKFIELII